MPTNETKNNRKGPIISIIAALLGKTRAIGKNNDLLFRIPNDLKRFKELTSGHPIIMGRKTFESIGRPLPGRKNIVISRSEVPPHPEVILANSLEEAVRIAEQEHTEIFIIGGGEIYKQALPIADKLYLTIVESEKEGDTFFPEYPDFKKMVFEEKHSKEAPPYTFLELER